jgi:exonuclease VII small subunit
MKKILCYAVFSLSFFVAGVSAVHAQTQELGGYTFIKGETSSQVCLGTWMPPTDVGKPGICEGQVVDVSQLAAISSKQSVDRLDQLVLSLSSIDQRLAVSNDELQRLVEITAGTQASLEQQVQQVGELLKGSIASRFDEMPKEILSNALFKRELERLKDDILRDVDKYYQPRMP